MEVFLGAKKRGKSVHFRGEKMKFEIKSNAVEGINVNNLKFKRLNWIKKI